MQANEYYERNLLMARESLRRELLRVADALRSEAGRENTLAAGIWSELRCLEHELLDFDKALAACEASRSAASESGPEIARLRARVRVEADDVRVAGVMRAHVVAWLRSNEWAPPSDEQDRDFTTWRALPPDSRGVNICHSDDAEAIAGEIRTIAYHFGISGLDVLEGMASMIHRPPKAKPVQPR